MDTQVKVEVTLSYNGMVYSDIVYLKPKQFNSAEEFSATVTGELDRMFRPRPLWDLIVEKEWQGEGTA